jgi:hypothetical protein
LVPHAGEPLRWNLIPTNGLSFGGNTEEVIKRISLAAAALLLCAAPASAQTFYVVQDTKTKKCTIVEQKPTVETMVVVGDGKVFKSRTEAEGAVKTITVCN